MAKPMMTRDGLACTLFLDAKLVDLHHLKIGDAVHDQIKLPLRHIARSGRVDNQLQPMVHAVSKVLSDLPREKCTSFLRN
jgi:hypothetical protein